MATHDSDENPYTPRSKPLRSDIGLVSYHIPQ